MTVVLLLATGAVLVRLRVGARSLLSDPFLTRLLPEIPEDERRQEFTNRMEDAFSTYEIIASQSDAPAVVLNAKHGLSVLRGLAGGEYGDVPAVVAVLAVRRTDLRGQGILLCEVCDPLRAMQRLTISMPWPAKEVPRLDVEVEPTKDSERPYSFAMCPYIRYRTAPVPELLAKAQESHGGIRRLVIKRDDFRSPIFIPDPEEHELLATYTNQRGKESNCVRLIPWVIPPSEDARPRRPLGGPAVEGNIILQLYLDAMAAKSKPSLRSESLP